MTDSQKTWQEVLIEIMKGVELYEITFVLDYYVLSFQLDGNRIYFTILNPSWVESMNAKIKFADYEFPSKITSFIGRRPVESNLIEHECYVLQFGDDVALKISLKAEDYKGPEGLLIHYANNEKLIVL